MKRRSFFKNLGMGVGVAILSPQLLFSSEELVPSYIIPKYPGIDGSTFKIKFDKKFEPHDILSYDIEYGQALIVVARKGFTHEVKVFTDDKNEWYLRSYLKKGTTFYKLEFVRFSEYDTNTSGFKGQHERKIIETKII